jgi:type III secretory pathway component EscS
VVIFPSLSTSCFELAGVTIQAGRHAGLAGHHIEESLFVTEYDDDGNAEQHASTLDEFAQFFAIYVDFGLFFFTMANAGVKIERFGAMTMLILISEWLGKFVGIVGFYELAHFLGYPPPLGVRRKHIMVMGLIAGLGLTVALFVADVAFQDQQLKADAKLGAVITPLIGIVCWGISKFYDFSHEDVAEEERKQLEEEIEREAHHIEHTKGRTRSHSNADVSGNTTDEDAGTNTRTATRVGFAEGAGSVAGNNAV